jgi:hypothetical protein
VAGKGAQQEHGVARTYGKNLGRDAASVSIGAARAGTAKEAP